MIDAATALRYLRDLPDGDVLVTAPHQRTTGITFADLRRLLDRAELGEQVAQSRFEVVVVA